MFTRRAAMAEQIKNKPTQLGLLSCANRVILSGPTVAAFVVMREPGSSAGKPGGRK